MRLKIMNYNILHGFHQNSAPFKLEHGRLNSARELIARNDPDLLMLTEACYGTRNPFGFILNYRTVFQFPYGAVAGWGNYEWGNCLLSKYPFRSERIPLLHRSALRAHMNVGGKDLMIDLVHLPPEISEREKVETVAPLLTRQRRYILAGDFNALAPGDEYDAKRLLRGLKALMGDDRAEHVLRSLLQCGCIKSILAHDLQDTYRVRNLSMQSTVPTCLLTEPTDSAMRIDYIFASRDLQVVESGIIKQPLTDLASDHYPCYATVLV